jgi:hypothetical protein
MEHIDYAFSQRDAMLENLRASGKSIVEDVTIDLDAQGVPQTCYCMVVDAPEPQPDLLADADARILDLEYENLLLKGGLTT